MAVDEGTLDAVFAELRTILKQYDSAMVVKTDTETEYYLNTRRLDKNKKPIFFGAVKINKNYVSYHFMPVYIYPQLLDAVSEGLRKRMQGKSCFNFTKVDNELFGQLAQLTAEGVDRARKDGFR